MRPLVKAYISVGSNLGDKLANCRRGVDRLVQTTHSNLVAQSHVYQTEPVDDRDQDWFVNYVVALETDRDPLKLLADINRVEKEGGRVRSGRKFGPRTLDLDILLFGDRIIAKPRLTVPHPRLHKRHFVLRPLCDINPDIIHPILHRSMQQLLDELDATDQQVMVLE